MGSRLLGRRRAVGRAFLHRVRLNAGAGTEMETGLPNLINPTQIDAGPQHYCAIDDEGVKCWGWNGNLEAQPLLWMHQLMLRLEGGRPVIDLGQVKCWGLQANYFLPPTLNEPFDVAVGAWHTCAIEDGALLGFDSHASRSD